jgi:hypothetical protein
MSKIGWFLLLLFISIGTLFYLVYDGFEKGKSLSFSSNDSDLAAGMMLLSMNPVSRYGFRLGYIEGKSSKQELDEWYEESYGPWHGYSNKDKLTDFENQYLSATGDIGPHNDKAQLTLRCDNDKTEVYIHWGGYLISDSGLRDRKNLTYRVDANNANTNQWIISTDNKALFYNGKTIQFILSLFDSEKLFVQFDDSGTKTVTFPIKDLRNKIVPLATACHWDSSL